MGTYCNECGEKLRYDEDNWDKEKCGRCLGVLETVTKERDELKEILKGICDENATDMGCPLANDLTCYKGFTDYRLCEPTQDEVAACWWDFYTKK